MAKSDITTIFSEAYPSEIRMGVEYYPNQHRAFLRLAERYGFTLEQVAGAFAALSPMSKERDTYVALERCMQWVNMGMIGSAPRVTFTNNRDKALAILRGADPRRVLASGRKVLSFFYNTINPDDRSRVTIDRHLLRAWSGKRPSTGFETGLSLRMYERIRWDVVDAAKEIGLVPCRLQSIVWIVQRRLSRHGQQSVFDFDFDFWPEMNLT
jgi:hypothetical protein